MTLQKFTSVIAVKVVKKVVLVVDLMTLVMVVMKQLLKNRDLMLQVEAPARVLKQDFLKQENIEFV